MKVGDVMAFGAKINLTPNTAGKDKFQKDIQKFANDATQGNPIKIRNITFDISDPTNKLSSVQKKLDDAGGISIKIKEVDASGAIKKLRSDIQEMLSGLNIVGLKDFLGSGDTAKIAKDIDKAKQSSSQWASQLKTIQTRLNTVYSSALSGDKMIHNESEINEITNLYSKWQDKVQALKDAKSSLSEDELKNLQNEGIAIQRKITLIQEEEKASKKVAVTQASDAKKSLLLAQQQVSLKSQLQKYILSNSRAYMAYGDALDGLMHRLSSNSELTEEDLKEIRRRLVEIQIAARDAGLAGNTFFTTMKKGFEKFGGWSLVTRSLTAVYKIFKDMVEAVKDMDSAMTELKKVTDETDSTYARFINNAASRSKKVGADLVDIIKATSDYSRLGYDLSTSEELADASIIYKNVGDGIANINEASESIISTMQAFGVAAQDAISIVDKFNEVGNNFAISSKGIGDALLNSASAMSAANSTLDETIGLITAANTVIQDPDKVGTALKTVSMYLRAAKTEAEDAGESTEGMAKSVSELRNEILALTSNKVDIQIDDDTFKSPYKIFEELSKVWSSLSDISQANILELIGGKRNSNVVSALLNNFEIAEDALAASMESANSAIEENKKELESIEGRVALLKAQFQELSAVAINSDFIKGLIDAGTALLKVVQFLTESKGLFISIAGIIATINVNKIGSSVLNIISNIKSFSFDKIRENYVAGLNCIVSGLHGVELSSKQAALATKALQSSMLAITLVLTVVTSVYQAIKQKIEEHEEAVRKDAEAIKSAAQEEANDIKTLINLQKQYTELISSMHGSAFSDKELETVSGIQEQINGLLDDQKEKVDLINGSYEDQIKKLRDISYEKAKANIADANTSVYNAGQDLLTAANEFDGTLDLGKYLSFEQGIFDNKESEKIVNSAKEWMRANAEELLTEYKTALDKVADITSSVVGNETTNIKDNISGFGVLVSDIDNVKDLIGTYETLTSLREHLKEIYGEENAELLNSSRFYQQLQAVLGNLQASYNEYIKVVESAAGSQAVITWHENFSNTIVESRGDYISLTAQIKLLYGENEQLCNSLLALANVYFPQFSNALNTASDSTKNTAGSISSIVASASSIESKLNSTKDAFKDFKENGYVSATTLKDLNEEFSNIKGIDNYISKIAQASNTSEFESSMKDLILVYVQQSGILEGLGGDYDVYIEKLMSTFGISKNTAASLAALNSVESALDSTSKTFDASNITTQLVNIGISAANASGYVSALGRVLSGFSGVGESFKDAFSSGGSNSLPGLQKTISAFLKFTDAFKDNASDLYSVAAMIEEIDSIKQNILDDLVVDLGGYYDKPSSNKTEEYIAETDRLYDAKQRLLEIQNKINNIESQTNLTDDLETQIKLHEQLIVLYNDEISAQKNLNSQRDKIIQDNISKLRAYGFDITYDPARDDLYIKNQEHINDLKGKDTEATNKLRKEYEELIKDTISLNDENKDIVDNINKLTESIKTTTSQVKKLREEIYQSDIDNLKFELSIAQNDEAKGEYLLSYWSDIIKRVKSELDYYLEQGYDITSDTIQTLMNDLREAEGEFETIVQDGYEKIQTTLDKLSSYYKTLIDAADEFSTAGFITIDTLESILGFGAEYMKYLLDETGAVNFNREAIEKLIAAKIRNYTISQAQAFIDEVKKNEDNAEALKNLADATYEANDAALLYLYTQINALNISDELKERYTEIIDGIITMGESAVQGIGHTVEEVEDKLSEQQDAINSIIDLTKDYVKQQAQDEIDNLNKQIDKYNEIVDLKKEQLSLAKEEAAYEKEVSDSVKSIAELQAEIDKLALDDSIEAQSKRSELIDQLNEKQSALADKQDEYSYDEIIQALDNSKDEYQSIVQKQIDAINDSISSEQKLYDAAIKLLDLDWNGTMNALKSFNYNMGSLLTGDLEFTIKIATGAVNANGGVIGAINSTGANGSSPDLGDGAIDNTIADGSRPSETIESAGEFLANLLGQLGDKAGGLINIIGSISGQNKIISGDANGDKKVTAADARLALRAASKLETLTDEQARAADVDGDGKVTSSDARDILRTAAGLDKDSIATMTAEDISKALWLAIELDSHAAINQYSSMLSEKIGSAVYQAENGEWYVMTPQGSKKLFDLYPKYHTGGIAGENATHNDKEIMAVLERGELVLNERKKETLYELVDFADAMGRILNLDAQAIRSFSGIAPILTTAFKTNLPFASSNNLNFAPNIDVHIDSFKGTEDDAKTVANIIGKTAMDYMYKEFNKRGISSIGSAFLKK